MRIIDHWVSGMAPDGDMNKWFGKTMTIRQLDSGHFDGYRKPCYRMVEDKGEFTGFGWYWSENMIAGLAEDEPSEDEPAEDWTEDEIEQARQLVTDLACDVIYGGGDIRFYKDIENHVSVNIFPDAFTNTGIKTCETQARGKDVFNPWIGKCVAICKVLGEPIPEFILEKNKR